MVPPTPDEVDKLLSTRFQIRGADETSVRRAGQIVVEVVEGADKGKRFPLDLQRRSRLTAGRSRAHDIVLTDESVSTSHFELVAREDLLELRDLGSRNGLWLNNLHFERATLNDGAEFFAGQCKLRVRLVGTVDLAVSTKEQFGPLVGRSAAMRELFAQLDRIAPSPFSVLVLGETGCGKELVARAIHDSSDRRKGPFVVLDCGSIPRELAESAVLGHRRGAFTGANADRKGCFEEADGGTLFLDEIGELPPELQMKLFRPLESREVQRVGDDVRRPVNVRVVAATNRDLRQMVASDRFRIELYHRLAQIEVLLPPLRQRPEDIAVLAAHFVAKFAESAQRPITLGADAIELLQAQPWEGNVRQLRNAVERSAWFAEGAVLGARDLVGLPMPSAAPLPADEPHRLIGAPLKEVLDDVERRYCREVMAACRGDVNQAADRAGYSRKGFREMLRRHRLLGDDSGV